MLTHPCFSYRADYQDDPSADDLPNDLPSFLNGFETRGKSYFIGVASLRTWPLDLSLLEICAVGSSTCVASCLSVSPEPAATCSATNGMSDAQRAVALVAGVCGSARGGQPYFDSQTRSRFYGGGFYANEASMQRGEKAPGYENKGWACPQSSNGMGRYSTQTGSVGWHVWGWGLSLDNSRSNVEIGNDCSGPNPCTTCGGGCSCTSNTGKINGHVGIVFARQRIPRPPTPPALPSPPMPPPAPPLAPITTCLARVYTSAGQGCDTTSCSSWGVGSRCCRTNHDGYCSSAGEVSSSDPTAWVDVSSCASQSSGIDFIRVEDGCGIEVASMANGGGLMMTFGGDALVCGNPYPCDRVRSVRLFPFESPPPSPPAAPSPPAWPPSVFTSVFEFGGSSNSFHYSSPLWTSDATHSAYDSTWRRFERKTEYTSYVTNMVRLEMTRADTATATSVLLPIDPPASLQSIFNGPYRATNGSEADWRALSGYGTMQPYCNRQGFNIQGQPANGGIYDQRDARIGMYFNDQNDCSSPDTGRVVGGTSRSAIVQGGADVWVTISILMMLVPPSLPPSPPPPTPPPPPSSPGVVITNTSNTANLETNNDGGGTMTIVVSAIAAVALVVALSVAAFVFLRRRKRARYSDSLPVSWRPLGVTTTLPFSPLTDLHSTDGRGSAGMQLQPLPASVVPSVAATSNLWLDQKMDIAPTAPVATRESPLQSYGAITADFHDVAKI